MRRHGLILVALAAILWGTDSLFRRPLTQSLSPVTIVFLEHFVLVLVAMALIPGLAPLIFYYHGLRLTSASLASIGELAYPITAVAANGHVLGIRLTVIQSIGAFVLAAVVTILTLVGLPSPGMPRARPCGSRPGERTA